MKIYIGCKVIRAKVMNLTTFNKNFNKVVTHTSEEGYYVQYSDGYISWLPKDVFEKTYRRLTSEEGILICG